MILLSVDRDKEKKLFFKKFNETIQSYAYNSIVYYPYSKGDSEVTLYNNGKKEDSIALDSLASISERKWKTSSMEEYRVDTRFSIFGFKVLTSETEKKEDITSLANILMYKDAKDNPERQLELRGLKSLYDTTDYFSLEQLEEMSNLASTSGLDQILKKEIDRATRIIEYLYENIIFTYQIERCSYDFIRFEFYHLENFVPYFIFDRVNLKVMTGKVSFLLKDMEKYGHYLRRLLPIGSEDYDNTLYMPSKRKLDTYQNGQDFFFYLDNY